VRKQGRLVTIYQDPLTCQKPEGVARLVNFIETTPDGLQLWEVRFKGDEGVFKRLVNFVKGG
jgi:hypothetical protein